LMRPANIVTAIADILAGAAIGASLSSVSWATSSPVSPIGPLAGGSGNGWLFPLLMLALATIGLYGGGVVLNDVFDAALDKKERPERPIPSGLISKTAAALFGILLLLGGILAAAFAGYPDLLSLSTLLAVLIALAAVAYDKWMKHHPFFGPLNMGVCRGLNLLLGMSLVAYAVSFYWFIALLPVIYIAAITMISRGEVHGGKKTTLYGAMALYIFVVLAIAAMAALNNTLPATLPFLLVFSLLIFPALQRAVKRPEGPMIGKAVKAGVVALILMDASLAASFSSLYVALVILLLFPLSYLLSRLFAVT